jgi:hypothetical protein
MAKKLFCGLFFSLLFSNDFFAEKIYDLALSYLKNTRNDKEFADAAEDWEFAISVDDPLSTDRLSEDVFNAISRELSRWKNLSIGDVFIFSCYTSPRTGYDVMLRVTRVNNDGSCSHYVWYAWKLLKIYE